MLGDKDRWAPSARGAAGVRSTPVCLPTPKPSERPWPLELSALISQGCAPGFKDDERRYLCFRSPRPHGAHPNTCLPCCLGFSGGSSGEELACQCKRHKRCEFDLWVGKIPRRRAWLPTPVFLSAESQGQRSLAGLQSIGSQSRTRLK